MRDKQTILSLNFKTMTTYNATYKFEAKGICYEANVNGLIFDKANEEINFIHAADLNNGFAERIINAVIWEISDDKDGMFIDGLSTCLINTQLMQSNSNESYYVLIENNLYPISMNVKLEVISNTFELLK